mgnify:CR=1 FL=1
MKDEEKNENSSNENGQDEELIREFGQSVSQNAKHLIHCLTVIGQVEGHYVLAEQNKTTKYEHIIPALVAIEQDRSVEGLLIILNTVGGDVEAGLAIAELISGMKTPTVSIVVGGGHSIGVPLAVSAKHSFIVPTATMLVHPVRMNGTLLGAPQTYYQFNQMQERIVSFISSHTKIKKERLETLMLAKDTMAKDLGTILVGKNAVEEGLIAHVGNLQDAIESLEKKVEEKKEDSKL